MSTNRIESFICVRNSKQTTMKSQKMHMTYFHIILANISLKYGRLLVVYLLFSVEGVSGKCFRLSWGIFKVLIWWFSNSFKSERVSAVRRLISHSFKKLTKPIRQLPIPRSVVPLLYWLVLWNVMLLLLIPCTDI